MSAARLQIGIPSVRRGKSRPRPHGRRARIGIIGAGWWSTTVYMPLLHARRDVELVSVCGLDERVLARCQRDFGFIHATTDYRELLRQSLDGVIIASPHSRHAEHALAAVKAGCHAMVEKPLTTDARSARQLVTLARRRHLQVLVPCGWQYRPIGVAAKRLMDAGRVGRIEYVLCHMASPLRPLFTGRKFEFTADAYVPANLSTWADPRISGGGYAQGQLPHSIGLLLWLTGLRPKSVFARMANAEGRVDLYDALSVSFAGGAIGTISGAATLPAGIPGTFQLDIRIFGTRGMLHLDIARDHLSWHGHNRRTENVPLRAGDGAYQCDGPPNQFVDLILGHTKINQSPGDVAADAVALLDAAYRSVRTRTDQRA